jgi:endo-1,4-beta-xylanase
MIKPFLYISILILSTQCSKDTTTTPIPNPTQPTQVTTDIKPTTFANSNDDCNTITLKGLADFPVGFAYGIGNKFQPEKNQRNKENDKNVLDNSDRVTLQLFYTSLIWKGLNEDTKAVTMDYIDTDKEIAYSKSVGLKVFAHCLIYPLLLNDGSDSNFATPQFFLDYVAKPSTTNNDIKIVLQNYLNNVLTKYKDDIDGLDLINELLGYDGSGNAQNTWLRKRFKSDTEMYNFVADLFVYAKSVAPKIKFFYNENGQENPQNNFIKSNKTIEILNIIKSKGGIDGYGLQMHTKTDRSIKDIETAIKAAVKTGLLVHISEMDIAIGSNPTTATLEMQRVKYREIVEAYKRLVPKEQQYGITMWDTNDKQSWLTGENATLFDDIAQKKLAFYGFAEGAGAVIGTATQNGSGKIYTNTSCK